MTYVGHSLYEQAISDELQKQHEDLQVRISDISAWTLAFVPAAIENKKANEYLQHGVCRRLGVIGRSSKNIFNIFPPDRQVILTSDELNDIQINLHAFLINIYGVLDNMAWVYVWEYEIESLLIPKNRRQVGLFNKEIQAHLSIELRELLDTDDLKVWYNEYAKVYRDALAHRIPLYVPPFEITKENGVIYNNLNQKINEQMFSHNFNEMQRLYELRDSLTSICGVFLHSFTELNKGPIALHKQLIEDMKKILLISNKFIDAFKTVPVN